MPTVTLTSKGQVTIPQEVRKQLGLHQGDRIEFQIEVDGSLRLRPVTRSVRELAGILHRPDLQARSLQDMNEDICEWMASENERIRSGA